MPAGDQPCLQHCTKQQCESDLECLQRTYGTSLGNKDSALDLQAQDATRRGVGYIQGSHCLYVANEVEENGPVLFGRNVR